MKPRDEGVMEDGRRRRKHHPSFALSVIKRAQVESWKLRVENAAGCGFLSRLSTPN